MANFIQTLQAENQDKADRIAAALEEMESFRAILLSPKHQGVDSAGQRNDWISTGDVLRRLEIIRQQLAE